MMRVIIIQNSQIKSSDTNQEIDYKTYYNDPRFKSRKRFIVSFITGAIIGSTIGLLTKNKANQKLMI